MVVVWRQVQLHEHSADTVKQISSGVLSGPNVVTCMFFAIRMLHVVRCLAEFVEHGGIGE